MYFRDLVFLVEKSDVSAFMAQVLTLIHEQHTRLNLAVAFPHWENGAPSRDSRTRDNYAQLGSVLRLFSPDKQVMDAVLDVLGLNSLVSQKILFASPAMPAPAVTSYVAYCRVRIPDKLRKAYGEWRETLKDTITKNQHTWAVLPFTSVSSGTAFQLYVSCKHQADISGLEPGELTSFGLSKGNNPVFVPNF